MFLSAIQLWYKHLGDVLPAKQRFLLCQKAGEKEKENEIWGPLGQRFATESLPELSTGKALSRCNVK